MIGVQARASHTLTVDGSVRKGPLGASTGSNECVHLPVSLRAVSELDHFSAIEQRWRQAMGAVWPVWKRKD